MDCLIRSVHKRELDLPVSTSNRRFAAFGVHDSYSELLEAHLVNQLGPLSQTSSGCRLLARLALQPILPPAPPDRIADSWHQKLWVAPLPRNMDTVSHPGRWAVRVRALKSQHGSRPGVFYVDVAGPSPFGYFSAAVIHERNTIEGLSFRASSSTQAEKLAIALAASHPNARRVGLRPPRAESYWEEAPKREEVSKQVARRLVVLPLPRSVHPDRNKERRVARARALAETYADDAKAVYVDAAKHQRKPKTYVAAVVRATDGKVLNACSVRATSAEQAEEAAIALALSGIPEATTILSDSRTAIANFGRGNVGTPAASLLPRTKSTTTHLRWFPAHVGVIPGGAANRNEEADVVARELAYRAAPPPPRPSEADEADFLDPAPLLDYGGILAWYREGRRALPGPHPRLGRREGVLLRQLQTGTVLTPALARHVCPGLFESATCSVCARELATLAHVLWGCDACAGGTVRDSLPPDMEHYISSPDHQAQLQAIQRLDAALARQKRTEATPSRKRRTGPR
ncbi:hypothetical protein HPB49_015365 [Dermacentor silvarum]|uniref:Uncharacterized protein n=1 Tax=Dermacentor silvarum TaxID=543639 RepID=A0ACB8CLG8_DERSI|nr:hypothetical protein HPB49_015365 [Dermacentor silvarum]